MPTLTRGLAIAVAMTAFTCGGNTDTTPDGSTDATIDGPTDTSDSAMDAVASDAPVDSVSDVQNDVIVPGDGGDGCLVIEAGAPYIVINDIAGYAPGATGGSVAIGRYYAESEAHYTGDGGATGSEGSPFAYTVEVFSASTGALRIDSTGAQPRTFTYTTSGTTMKIVTLDCLNSTNTIQFEYATDGGALAWLPDAGAVGYALSFTKQ